MRRARTSLRRHAPGPARTFAFPPLREVTRPSWLSRPSASMFEELDGALPLLSRRSGLEGSEIAAPAGSRIPFSRIESVLSRCQFSDHGVTSLSTGHSKLQPA